MKYSSFLALVFWAALLTACGPVGAIAQEQGGDAEAAKSAEPAIGGNPLAAARRQAIHAKPFQRPLDAEKIKAWMEISSRATMAEFELFLAPLTDQETRLLKKVQSMTPPIVNRLHFADLREVLKHGGLASFQREQEQQREPRRHTTPALENKLYDAYDCVFASVGPPDGAARYGDVIIRLKDSVRERAWATPFSGMHFLTAVRGKDGAAMQRLLAEGRPLPAAPTDPLSLGFDERLHFSHYVVAEADWHKALAYQAILVLRNLDDSDASQRVRRRCEVMLAAEDAREFWTLFIPPLEPGLTASEQAAREPLGYLEAKFTDKLSIEDFTSIEVEPARLEEVRAWPEAKPYLKLIRAQARDVR